MSSHIVEEARSHGWDTLRNGELLDAAEAAGFDVLATTDRNISYQQYLTGRRIAVVVLGKGRWRLIRRKLREIVAAISTATPGSFTELELPERAGGNYVVWSKGFDMTILAGPLKAETRNPVGSATSVPSWAPGNLPV